jgi:hypothetical protein
MIARSHLTAAHLTANNQGPRRNAGQAGRFHLLTGAFPHKINYTRSESRAVHRG